MDGFLFFFFLDFLSKVVFFSIHKFTHIFVSIGFSRHIYQGVSGCSRDFFNLRVWRAGAIGFFFSLFSFRAPSIDTVPSRENALDPAKMGRSILLLSVVWSLSVACSLLWRSSISLWSGRRTGTGGHNSNFSPTLIRCVQTSVCSIASLKTTIIRF